MWKCRLVITAVLAGGSQSEAARRYGVSLSTAKLRLPGGRLKVPTLR